MKKCIKFILAMLGLGISSTGVASPTAACPSTFHGQWTGVLNVGGTKLTLVLHVEQDTAGKLSATASCPEQGFSIPVDTITLNDGLLKFTIKSLQASYEGSLNAQENEVVGTFTQGMSLPLIFKHESLCTTDVSSVATTHVDDATIIQKVDEYISACVDQKEFNGAVLVARGGKVLVNKGYGMADFEHQIPCTPTTKFRLGSITKQFTAMAIMKLQEQGHLNVSDSISKYISLTEFPLGDQVTIYHCLTNTPGLQDYLNCPDSNFAKSKGSTQCHTATEIIASFKDAPLEFEPGSRYKYCNSGWILLTAIIERISGMSYEGFLQKNIFQSLGMVNTCSDSQQKEIEGRACGYTRNPDDFVPAGFVDMSCAQGAGILLSSLEDMYAWDRALYTDRLVSKASLDTLFTPNKDNYACGWVVSNLFNKKCVWHNGATKGCSTWFYRFIEDDVCVIVLSNLDTVNRELISTTLAAIVFGEKYELPKKRIAITVDTGIYDQYVGQYKLSEAFILTVTKEDGKLLVQATGQEKIEVYPASETEFFCKVIDAQLFFVKDENGNVTKLILLQGGGYATAEKI